MTWRSRNFYNPKGKPRMYQVRVAPTATRTWWKCKSVNRFGDIIGFGQGRSMEAAYNAYVRNVKWRNGGMVRSRSQTAMTPVLRNSK